MIKTYNHTYKNETYLLQFIEKHGISSNHVILIQAYIPKWDPVEKEQLKKLLLNTLPKSIFIEVPFHFFMEKDHSQVLICFSDFGEIQENLPAFKEFLSIDHQLTMATMLTYTAQKIEKMQDYFYSIFNNFPGVAFTTDLNGCFKSVNTAFKHTFGMGINEAKGVSVSNFVLSEKVPIKKYFRQTLSGESVQFEMDIKVKTGKLETFIFHMIPINIKGKMSEVLMVGNNITAQRMVEKKLERIAYYDPDSGLPNRVKFYEILEIQLTKAKRFQSSLTFMFIDLDRFKLINDMIGHYAGDTILQELANRIAAELPAYAYLGRFSGDKFSIIFPTGMNPEDVMDLGKTLLHTIQKPFLFEQQELLVTASAGISVYPYDGQDHVVLMKNADAALNRAKQLGGNTIVFYADEMNKGTMQRVELEHGLRKGIENNELYLVYQPIYNTRTNMATICEALLRWEHPKYGLIPPSEFIPIAEEIGLIDQIGTFVLEKACKQVNEWRKKGYEQLSVSVNVSAYQFKNKRFIEEVKNALALSGLDAKCLHLELTESAMLNHSLETMNTMEALRDLGVNISIDDFGTGYSSLSYLKHLPIHRLKIDRSFIQQFKTDSPDFAIVNAILTMGHGLGLNVVAEGVETEEQLDLLMDMGCDYIQGYLIERPLKPKQFEQWYNKYY